ncbi:hypothetical protein SUGI_0214060 [Cryptomeria japonica]|nr:hypothetical protein SUGI_0214060 [Cryptomeria japonica]
MEQVSSSPCELPLLNDITSIAEDGYTDLHGKPVSRFLTGGWKASLFIITVEIAERFAYCGISSNLITYLTTVMQQSTPTAAKNVNLWSSAASMFPLIGAFVADSLLGRYWTIFLSSLIYVLGLFCLTLSASLTFLNPYSCKERSIFCTKPSAFQVRFFFVSLYMVALGEGGHRPCVEAFGADQFDEGNPTERKYKSSFFNWWYFGICTGSISAVSVLVYIQENVGWGWGFGIPTMAMGIAFSVFFCGTSMYRHKLPSTSPVTRIAQVFVAAIRKWNVSVNISSHGEEKLYVTQEFCKGETRKLMPTNQFRLLDKATVAIGLDYEHKTNINWRLCTVTQVEEGATMNRKISGNIEIPAATLQMFISLTILVLVPMYDKIFVPLARSITGNERGITLLQRIGVGIFFSVIAMIVAALIEMKRLQTAKEYGLVDLPHATIPLSIFWMLPQYILFGMSEMFAMIGLQEYFYDQMPDTMRSLGIAMYLSVFGVGSFFSSILISLIEKVSSTGNKQNWFADNLNKAHLDYFYWLLAALNALFLCIYLAFSSCFIYKKVESHDEEIS